MTSLRTEKRKKKYTSAIHYETLPITFRIFQRSVSFTYSEMKYLKRQFKNTQRTKNPFSLLDVNSNVSQFLPGALYMIH